MRGFASDNHAGAHPAVLAALHDANDGHVPAYGDDAWTTRAHALVRERFGADASPWIVFNGTAANVLALRACCASHEAVITPATSHLHVDEAAAPERLAGTKVLTVPTADGRLVPADLPPLLTRRGDPHAVQPRVVSIANATELGTVYDAAQVRNLADDAHDAGMLLHVDGARLANAIASTGASPAALTTDAGADVLSLGLTKTGALGAELVVFLGPGHDAAFAWTRKQHAQLASKMRFLAAQVVALLQDDLWLSTAAHANAMAARLARAVADVPEVRITRPTQANAVFAVLPDGVATRLRERYAFHTWDEASGEVRWMCAWDTTPGDVDAFAALVGELCAAAGAVGRPGP